MRLMIDGVNIFNPLEGKMDKIIEVMVDFYGEKHRERIEKRLNDAKFIFVPVNNFQPLGEKVEGYYFQKEKQILNELYSQFTEDKKRVKLLESIYDLDKLKNNIENDDYDSSIFYSNALLQFMGILKSRDDLIKEMLIKENIDKNDDRYWELSREIQEQEFTIEEFQVFMSNQNNKNKVLDFLNNMISMYESTYKAKIEDINNEEKH